VAAAPTVGSRSAAAPESAELGILGVAEQRDLAILHLVMKIAVRTTLPSGWNWIGLAKPWKLTVDRNVLIVSGVVLPPWIALTNAVAAS